MVVTYVTMHCSGNIWTSVSWALKIDGMTSMLAAKNLGGCLHYP